MEKTEGVKSASAYFEAVVEWLRQLGFSFSGTNAGWSSLQIALILTAFVVAAVGKRKLAPYFKKKIASLTGSKITRIAVERIYFSIWGVLLASSMWLMLIVMRQITWASHSHLLFSAASLATAWLVISVVTKLFKNKTISKVVAVTAWTIAALSTLGLLPSAVAILDGAALQFDTFRLSVLTVLKGIAVFSALIWGALALGKFTDERLKAIQDLSPSMQVLAAKVIKAGLFLVAFFGGLSLVGIDFAALAVFSGAIGLGLGFGLQKVVSNLVSGFILLTDKSIKPGDVISVGDSYGRIDQLAARYVSVRARDGREYLVPNEDLITNQVINWTFSADRVRLDVDFGTSYNADPHVVREIAKKAAATVKRVNAQQLPVCHITEFGDSSINYVLRFWISDPDKGTVNIRGDVFLALWDALKEAGVEIPYPHRQVIIQKDAEALVAE